MKKLLLVSFGALFLAACGAGDVTVNIPKPMGEGNDGRIQQYLEEDVMASENAVCNFDWLHQPGGNVVEVWALCEEYALNTMGTEVEQDGAAFSMPVKITFANPTIHVTSSDGSEYMSSIEANFSEIAVAKIKNNEYDVEALSEKNLERAKSWLLAQ